MTAGTSSASIRISSRQPERLLRRSRRNETRTTGVQETSTLLEREEIKEIAETARIEDRNIFEALVPRNYEPGGKLPDDRKAFHDTSAGPPASLPKDLRDINAIGSAS